MLKKFEGSVDWNEQASLEASAALMTGKLAHEQRKRRAALRRDFAAMTACPARAQVYVILLTAALALAACSHGAPSRSNPEASESGILMGQIVSAASTPPQAGVEIKIIKPDGALVATARTDRQGHYRVILPAGEYRVERGAEFPGAARNLPARIAISPGEKTRFDIWVEPGKG